MPVYTYVCHSCGLESDVLRRMSEGDDPYTCPECDTLTKRAVTAPNVIVGGTPSFDKNVKRDLDVVVGAQAEQRWDGIKKEAAKRNLVRRKTGKMAMGRRNDGSYVPVPEGHLKAREEAYTKFEYAKKFGVKVERDD